MYIETGKLLSGKEWELIQSKNSAVKEGKHLILHILGDLVITNNEKKELLSISLDLAEKYTINVGRYRIAVNGPAQVTQSTFHIHIILPTSSDVLPRLVLSIDKITSEFLKQQRDLRILTSITS